jgi:GMP synthase (glutamine-hydrolysing)
MKILVLQIRENLSVQIEEMESFIKFSGITSIHFDSFNVFKTPVFDSSILSGYDALIVGGASEASVLEPKKYPFVISIITTMQYCIKENFPVFASCFGFQAAVLALEGKITTQKSGFELGTYSMTMTSSAKLDPVFKGIDNGFYAVSVHQEKATTLPNQCELLAYTESCAHAFRVKGKNFWAFQFHPELDMLTLKERLGIYQEKYTQNPDHFKETIDSLKETPQANLLVKNFIHFLKTI